MQFERLFTITCTHQYLANQPCNEVIIQPTQACQRLMQRYGLLYKNDGAGNASVLHQQPEGGKMAMPACISALNFYLLTTDAAFFTYTKTALQNSENMLLYTRPDKQEETALVSKEVAKWAGQPSQDYRLFGGLSIVPPAVFRNYSLNLDTLATHWQYYIVAEKNKSNFKIDGAAANTPFRVVSDAARLQKNSTYQALLQAYPDAPVLWYESETALPLSQKARTKIQLINADTGTPLFDSLPNPTPAENGVKIIHV